MKTKWIHRKKNKTISKNSTSKRHVPNHLEIGINIKTVTTEIITTGVMQQFIYRLPAGSGGNRSEPIAEPVVIGGMTGTLANYSLAYWLNIFNNEGHTELNFSRVQGVDAQEVQITGSNLAAGIARVQKMYAGYGQICSPLAAVAHLSQKFVTSTPMTRKPTSVTSAGGYVGRPFLSAYDGSVIYTDYAAYSLVVVDEYDCGPTIISVP